jgi:hypothetical protein
MRKTTKLVVFLVMLHAAAAFLAASGVAADMGAMPDPGGGEKVDTATSEAESVKAEGGIADTLFALYTSVTSSIMGVLRAAFALEIMLTNLGIPAYVTAFVAAPIPIIVGMDVVYALTGRDM